MPGRSLRLLTRLTTLLLVAALLVAPSLDRPGSEPASPSDAPSASDRIDPDDLELAVNRNWRPRKGTIFSNPLGNRAQTYKIYNQVRRGINHSRRGSDIFIASWNLRSTAIVNDLLRAQRRGVKVRLVMDSRNTSDPRNDHFYRLRRELRQYNRANSVPGDRRSAAKLCQRSCRGTKGHAHAKVYMFSHTGAARRVVMQSSFNATVAGAVNQWNDMFTWTGNRKVWGFSTKVFRQMWRDRPVRPPFTQMRAGKVQFYFTPFGSVKRDKALRLLKQVRCKGARNTRHNRTVVRVAPDAMRHQHGVRYARQFVRMHRQGCDVKIGYTVLAIKIKRYFDNNNVPLRHLVVDRDGDRIFDKYFHMKSFSIRGRIGNNRRDFAVMNGSANMSRTAAVSDENIMIIRGHRGHTMKTQRHINWWFHNFPRNARATTSYRGDVDPYAQIKRETSLGG